MIRSFPLTFARKSSPGSRAGALLVALGLVALSAGCARISIAPSPDPDSTTREGEAGEGEEATLRLEDAIGRVEDPDLEAYLDELGQRLAEHAPGATHDYRFRAADMPEANAFVLRGGVIYVSRGLLALVNSEDELAAVLGHEIAHVAARHAVRRQVVSAPLAPLQIVAALGGAAASIVSPDLGQVVAGIGQLPGAFAMAAYSRDQEREADELGQRLSADAGFDPMALSTFADTLAREEAADAGATPARPSFLVSHPPSPERASAARGRAAHLPIAQDLRVPLGRKDFLDHFDGLLVGEPAEEGVFVEERFLHPGLGIAFALPSGWATLNGLESVSAISADGSAHIVVEIVGEGEDALSAAEAFGRRMRLDAPPRSLEIHGLDAAEASALGPGPARGQQFLITWVVHEGLVYRIAGVAPVDRLADVRPDFKRTARSFHPLGPAERAEIFEDRLRLVEAGAEETLADLGARSGNRWSPARTALVNGLEETGRLRPGFWLKIAHPEPFEPGPAP